MVIDIQIDQMTLTEVAAFIGMSSLIGGCILFLFKLWSRFERMERKSIYRQEDMAILFECMRGCLEGLIQNGANGPVKEALKNLNRYTDNKAAGLTGDGQLRK